MLTVRVDQAEHPHRSHMLARGPVAIVPEDVVGAVALPRLVGNRGRRPRLTTPGIPGRSKVS